MGNEKNTKILSIGRFLLDPATGCLTDGRGEVVHLRKQTAEVLAVLASEAGRIVGKEKLIDAVWPGIATTDDSLVQCISDIRRTLGRDVVETFPKRGYRLRNGAGPDPPGISIRAIERFRLAWQPWLAVAAITLGVVAVLVLPLDRTRDLDTEPIVPPVVRSDRTIAVLPFFNLSGDPGLRFFSDGLSEDLVTDLSKVADLTVISHASSFDFRDAEFGFRAIADELGVRYLVRGTVRHHEDRVRINVALIDPRDGMNIWAERFDRSRQFPFDVQEEIIRHIVEALSLELVETVEVARRVEPDAYYMLLRGLEPLRDHTAAGNLEARAYFERALEFDPEYARAHANIALTYARATVFRYADGVSPASIQRGVEAAITAIRFDPEIPDAYLALAMLNLALGEHANALAAARHSIRLDANFSDGYALLAEAGVHGGDLDEALAAIRRAKLLHPRYPFAYDWIEGHIYFQMGRHDAAEPLLLSAVEASPDFYRGLIVLAANYGHRSERGAAGDTLSKIIAINPNFSIGEEVEQSRYLFDDRRQRLAHGLQAAQ
jgi:TolB-like protein